jgi:hypothetical protein
MIYYNQDKIQHDNGGYTMSKITNTKTGKVISNEDLYPVGTLMTFLNTNNIYNSITDIKSFISENWDDWSMKDFLDYWNLSSNLNNDNELLYIGEDHQGDPFIIVYEDLEQMNDSEATKILHRCGYNEYIIGE